MNHHAPPSVGRHDGFHLLIAALDRNYAPKQFGRKNRGVIVAKPVATRDQAGFIEAARARHYSMNKQSPLLNEKDDFSSRDFAQAGPLYRNQITRKDGGHHASAEGAQAKHAERTDNFSGEATRQRFRHILSIVHKHSKKPPTMLSC
jgi:hypothetical protein